MSGMFGMSGMSGSQDKKKSKLNIFCKKQQFSK